MGESASPHITYIISRQLKLRKIVLLTPVQNSNAFPPSPTLNGQIHTRVMGYFVHVIRGYERYRGEGGRG